MIERNFTDLRLLVDTRSTRILGEFSTIHEEMEELKSQFHNFRAIQAAETIEPICRRSKMIIAAEQFILGGGLSVEGNGTVFANLLVTTHVILQ